MKHRADIDAILDRYRTKKAPREASSSSSRSRSTRPSWRPPRAPARPTRTTAAAAPPATSRTSPTAAAASKDLTTVTVVRRRDHRADLHLHACGHAETVRLSEFNRGKLVWKVDWPMRWAYEGVIFEPSGVDHSSPGSSFVVGGQIVREIFGGEQPIGPMYAFVGISGMAKMSLRKGGVPTPADALKIMEPPLLRWLYARRRPNQSFKIAFDQEIQRLYDEWDALDAQGRRRHRRCPPTPPRTPAPSAPPPVSCRAPRARCRTARSPPSSTSPPGTTSRRCASCSDLDPEQPAHLAGRGPAAARPAENWITTPCPGRAAHHRPRRARHGAARRRSDEQGRESLRLLLDGLDAHWSLDGLTHARLRRAEGPGRAGRRTPSRRPS